MGIRCRVAALAVCGLGVSSLGVVGCSSSSSDADGSPGAAGGTQTFAGAPPVGPASQYENGLTTVGQSSAPATKLPGVPEMTNVVGVQGTDGVSITFDPVDGALDYRVYPLPADGDITVSGDSVAVKDGTYRCAGNRESPPMPTDGEAQLGGQAQHTYVEGKKINEYTRTLAEATLGYVFSRPGPGLIPIYALGDPDPNADTTCYFGRYGATRVKKYTASEEERTQLLAARFRDDGVAFYVPESTGDPVTNIYSDEREVGMPFAQRFYFPEGPEADTHPNKVAAFRVLTNPANHAFPLMRVFYSNMCGWSHDELAVGKERFNRVRHQGDKLPEFRLNWSGFNDETTLVVEALDKGCPWQGYMAPQAQASISVPFDGRMIVHQPWVTFDQARASSASKELFINGQFAAGNKPKAVARAFIKVKPSAHPKMDFFETFSNGSAEEAFTTIPCDDGMGCYATWRQQSATFDQMFINAENSKTTGEGFFAFGRFMGEWWMSYADIAADTNGKYRMTAKQKATLSTGKYLHVTMEVDSYATSRRYPQILISTADAPVQPGLAKNHTIIVQPRAQITTEIDFPVDYELQVCNLRTWDVNNQCPVYDLYHLKEGGKIKNLAPNQEFGEHASVDHRVLYDVFTSTDRTYLFLDGQPYGCAILPPGSMPAGPVTVTWGDALYHSDVDHVYAFHAEHMKIEQRRHFDNLGFTSDGDAPKWDEARLPCAVPISLQE